MNSKLLLIIILLNIVSSCAQNDGTSTGNPLVSLKYQAYSPLFSTFAVNQINFCFKRVRFKKMNETTNPDPVLDNSNIDFDIGEKQITQSGDILGDVRVPVGNYTRVEFDLSDHCSNAYSVNLINSNGTFLTNQRITIKFLGNLNLTNDSVLILSLQPLINSLDTVSDNNSIKAKLENVSGEF